MMGHPALGTRSASVLLSCILVIAIAVFVAPPARAGSMDDRYKEYMADPGNLQQLYDYAQEAIRAGEFEAAIAALEGMLVISRNQPRVLLELGALYARVGAHTIAQVYLTRAKALTGDSEDLAALTEFFAGVVERATDRNKLKGFISAGVRHQSNPTGSPEASTILSGGLPVPNRRIQDSDINAFVVGRLDHRYEFESGSAVVSDVIAYVTRYDEQTQNDFNFLEAKIGYEFHPDIGTAREFSVHPYLLGRTTQLNSAQLETTLGAGLEFTYFSSPKTFWRAIYQYRDRDFDDIGRNSSSLRTGHENRLDMRFRTEIRLGQILSARVLLRDVTTQRKFLDYQQYDLVLRYTWWLKNKLFNIRRKVSLGPYVSRRWRNQDAPNPRVTETVTRDNREWRVGFNGRLPFSKNGSLTMRLEVARVSSNIPNNEFNNELVAVGIRRDF